YPLTLLSIPERGGAPPPPSFLSKHNGPSLSLPEQPARGGPLSHPEQALRLPSLPPRAGVAGPLSLPDQAARRASLAPRAGGAEDFHLSPSRYERIRRRVVEGRRGSTLHQVPPPSSAWSLSRAGARVVDGGTMALLVAGAAAAARRGEPRGTATAARRGGPGDAATAARRGGP
ncbi:hypothetical protein EJB05_42486, partial [Eragrostis curvula]